ncbi:MAG: 4Fe-4S binding protein [Candidatus Firestonebacteria bacterium]
MLLECNSSICIECNACVDACQHKAISLI